jgi:hypothetical protein
LTQPRFIDVPDTTRLTAVNKLENCFTLDLIQPEQGDAYLLLSSDAVASGPGIKLDPDTLPTLQAWGRSNPTPHTSPSPIGDTGLMFWAEDDLVFIGLCGDKLISVSDDQPAFEAFVDHLSSGEVPRTRPQSEVLTYA